MWKRLEATASFVLCQRCTNCSQQSCATDYVADTTKRNLKDQGRCRRSYQTLEQICQEWRIKMWVATVDFMKAFDSISYQSLWTSLEKLRNRTTLHMLLEKIIRGTERVSLHGQRKWHVWDKKTYETGRSSVQLTIQHGASNSNERRCETLAKHKTHPDKTKILSKPKYEQKRRSIYQQHLSWDTISVGECEISWEKIRFSNRKQQTSKIESGPPGLRSTDTNKSWRQNRTSYSTDSAYSKWWSRWRWAMLLELGHYQGITTEWYDRLNASLHHPDNEKI